MSDVETTSPLGRPRQDEPERGGAERVQRDELARLRRLIDRVGAENGGASTDAVSTGWPALDAPDPSATPVPDVKAVPHAERAHPQHPDVLLDTPPDVPTGGPTSGLALGVLHEWLGVARPHPALRPTAPIPGRSRRMAGSFGSLDWQPPLFLFAHLAACALEHRLKTGEGSQVGPNGIVVWIGKRVWPYPRTLVQTARPYQCTATGSLGASNAGGALRSFELELPRRVPGAGEASGSDELLSHSLFIDPEHDRARLWAIDVALRSKAVTAVVADASRLPIAATRRLQLAARAGNALCLLARPPWEERELSCATTRFVVRRSLSGDDRLRWSVRLLRAKGAAQSLAS